MNSFGPEYIETPEGLENILNKAIWQEMLDLLDEIREESSLDGRIIPHVIPLDKLAEYIKRAHAMKEELFIEALWEDCIIMKLGKDGTTMRILVAAAYADLNGTNKVDMFAAVNIFTNNRKATGKIFKFTRRAINKIK